MCEMIDYKKSTTPNNEGLIERVPSATVDGPISLTWIWEVITRTKRLPDDLDPMVLFVALRDRLRNPEREVRLHALRVLSDLIPLMENQILDQHMNLVLPELIINLSYVAPSVRKGAVDVFRIYLKHTDHPNDLLCQFMKAVPEDSHLMLGLIMAVPHFFTHGITEDTILFVLTQLFVAVTQPTLQETAVVSLAKIRKKIGTEKFEQLIGSQMDKEFKELCDRQNIHDTNHANDNVILETEITLETGPAITMKIHEETDPLPNHRYPTEFTDSEEELFKHKIDQSRITDDSESDYNEFLRKSPRKVRFGGEVVKMRTPESDSNQPSDDNNDIQTSVIIDRPTSINITVSEKVASIKTRQSSKSLIPVRVKTKNRSNPGTPRKTIQHKRLYKSAPELGRVHVSKIPLRRKLENSQPKQKITTKKTEDLENKNLLSPNLPIPNVPRIRRNSRADDEFSPVPIHNVIEVLHNLTRSPERRAKKTDDQNENRSPEIENTYSSFKVYSEDSRTENEATKKDINFLLGSPVKEYNSSFKAIIEDLQNKEDPWSRYRGLEDLIRILQEKQINFPSQSTSILLEALFACAQQQKLQSRAQEALDMVISTINPQMLQESFGQLSLALCKIGAPQGVRLSLIAMQRGSPKKFLKHLNSDPNMREAVLQVVIAAARTFPSSDIDVVKGTQLATEAMTDDRRRVRQAALETLASLAQVTSNTIILNTVTGISKNFSNSDRLLRVVRTRLSRKQLPTVDLNGNVRYSSPKEQEEFEWLCGVSNDPSTKILALAPSSGVNEANNNYWKHNSRHDTKNSYPDKIINDSTTQKIWTIDPSSMTKLNDQKLIENNLSLYPVYVLKNDQAHHKLSSKRSYRKYDRGRSNSPPKRQNSVSHNDEITASYKNYNNSSNDHFRKSFSSEQIYNGGNFKIHDTATSFSLSSRSSTTSTASSTKSGLWMREYKSGIPIPINGDMKFKLRSSRHPQESSGGPLLAQEPFNQTKIVNSHNTPILPKEGNFQITNQPHPPPSSGSESSGYFTPPAEHLLPTNPTPDRERFVADRQSPRSNNFDVIDATEKPSDFHSFFGRTTSLSSTGTSDLLEERLENVEIKSSRSRLGSDNHLEIQESSSSNSFDISDNPLTFITHRKKSKSEMDLKNTLPDIGQRKNINSAPPLNDIINIVPYNVAEPRFVTTVPVKTDPSQSLPYSNEQSTCRKKMNESPKRLLKRSISHRTPSFKKSIEKAKSFTKSVAPFSRPKDALQEALNQMESCDWETTIQGLQKIVRLAKYHPEILESQIHTVCVTLGKNIRNLRSQVARSACEAASELLSNCKKGLEMELEEIAAPLLHRTADTNKFIRSDANSALDVMTLHLSIPRVVSVITNKGSNHQNGVVRAASVRLLRDLVDRLGAERVFQLPKETREKFLQVGANGLTEGNLDARKHSKALLTVLAKHHHFQRTIMECVSQQTIRFISKTLNSLK